MKNRLKSVKRGSKSAATSQPKTTGRVKGIGSGASPASPPSLPIAILALYDWSTGKEIADCELTGEDFARIQAAVAKWAEVPIKGRDLSAFIREALLEAANRELFPGSPMQELESAVGQAKGVLRLALEHQSFVLEENHDDIGRDRAFELMTLCGSTTDRLQSAFKSAWNYAAGRAV